MLHGTIIHGTLRTQDLISAFAEVLRTMNPTDYAQLFSAGWISPYAIEDDGADWWDSDDAVDLLADLTERLEENAPEGHYFGAHPGDGADFGFWPLESEVVATMRARLGAELSRLEHELSKRGALDPRAELERRISEIRAKLSTCVD